MKTKHLIILLSLLLLNSCIVKSLHPFYTKETLSFDTAFLGKWKDNKNGKWSVLSFKEAFLKGNHKKVEDLNQEDLRIYNKYKKGYFVEYVSGDKGAVFIVMPFKIKHQLFLDFIPFEGENEGINSLQSHHIVYTHSLVKYDTLKDGSIRMKWLDEDKISTLFNDKKIRIQHEKIGLIDDGFLLTASSEELQKFIKKYMASKDTEKWKTSIKFTLTKEN